MSKQLTTTGIERTFDDNDIIVSKTDIKGRLTYTNKIFLDIAGYTETECLGQPHSMIRHPDMPRCIFKLLWDTLGDGSEIFAYVINRCKNGDHYWVYAHVTPSRDSSGNVTGYHSNRRVPDRAIVSDVITPLYGQLLGEEQKHSNRKDGLEASSAMLESVLSDKGIAYDEFVMTLGRRDARVTSATGANAPAVAA